MFLNRIKRDLEFVEVHNPLLEECGMAAKAKRVQKSVIPKIRGRGMGTPEPNVIVGRVLSDAFDKYWSPRSASELSRKSGLSDETIRRLRKGDIRSGRSVPGYCETIGIDPEAAMKGKLVRVHQRSAAPPDPLHEMLDAIKDTPMGQAIVAQIEAVHQSLVPHHDRKRKVGVS